MAAIGTAGPSSEQTYPATQNIGGIKAYAPLIELLSIYKKSAAGDSAALTAKLPSKCRTELCIIAECDELSLSSDLPRLADTIRKLACTLYAGLDPASQARVEDHMWRGYGCEIPRKPITPSEDPIVLLESLEICDREYLDPPVTTIDSLPNELLRMIADALPERDLKALTCSTKKMRLIGSDVSLSARQLEGIKIFKDKYPGLTIIGPEFWRRFGVYITALPINLHTLNALEPTIAELSALTEGGKGVTVLLMPAMTFRELMNFALLHHVPIDYFVPLLGELIDDVRPSREPSLVVITNSVIHNSRGLSSPDQNLLVTRMKFKIPGVIPGATLPIVAFLDSDCKVFHFGANPCTFARYTETLPSADVDDQTHSMIVGDFSLRSGLSLIDDEEGSCDTSVGVAAMREFKMVMNQWTAE